MRGFQQDCQVRIKTNSSPTYPDYLVEEFFYDDEDPEHPGQPVIMGLYCGRRHKAYPSSIEHDSYDDREWSRGAMNYLEVQSLIGAITGWQPKVKHQ
jgi:hypothetical protein